MRGREEGREGEVEVEVEGKGRGRGGEGKRRGRGRGGWRNKYWIKLQQTNTMYLATTVMETDSL